MNAAWIPELFRTIDAKDAAGFAAFLTEDGLFRFGNGPDVVGRAAVEAAVAGFFASVRGLSHALTEVWETPTAVLVQGVVTYTRYDGSQLSLPFFDLFRLTGGEVSEYLIYMDVAPLYAVAA